MTYTNVDKSLHNKQELHLKIGLKSGKIANSGNIKEFYDWLNLEMISYVVPVFSCWKMLLIIREK